MRLFDKGLILVGAPMILAVTVVVSMFSLIVENDRQRLRESHYREIAEKSTQAMLLVSDALLSFRRALRGWNLGLQDRFNEDIAGVNSSSNKLMGLMGRTANPGLKQVKEDIIEFRATQAELENLTKNDPEINKSLSGLIGLTDSTLERLGTLLSVARGKVSATDLITQVDLKSDFAHKSYDMMAAYRKLVAESLRYVETGPQKQEAVFRQECLILAISVLASIFLAPVLARWFAKAVSSRLSLMMENAELLARGQELHPCLSDRDEIAELDQAFHLMAEELTTAMAKERDAFENANDLMCMLDAQAKFTTASPSSERILGRAPDELSGKKLSDLLIVDEVSSTLATIEQAKQSGAPASFECSLRHRDGHLLRVSWSIYWSAGEKLFCAVAHDISELKRVELMKRQFLRMLSQDLESPLSSIWQRLRLIASGGAGKLPEAAGTRIDIAIRNVSRLLLLVNDLLEIEKLQATKLDLARQSVRIEQLLAQAVSAVDILADQRAVKIVIENHADEFSLNPQRMVQVLVNLLSNAIKFSGEGDTVRLISAQDRDKLTLRVIDNGRGIPVSDLQTIFERFKQVEQADGKRSFGSGLGLAICKTIVEQHGGKIGAESQPGQGSTFWITIPRDPQELEQAVSAAEGQGVAGAATCQGVTGAATCQTVQAKPLFKQAPPWTLPRMRLFQRGLILVLVPVVCELIFAGSLFHLLSEAFEERQNELHNRAIATTAEDLMICGFEMVSAANTGSLEESWQDFDNAVHQFTETETKLLSLTSHDEKAQRLVKEVLRITEPGHRFVKDLEQVVIKKGTAGQDLAKSYGNRFQVEFTEVIPVLNQLVSLANKKQAGSPARQKKLRSQQGIVLLGGLLASLGVCALSAFFFSIGITRRLDVLSDNVRRLKQGEKLNQALQGEDEIACLDGVFHSMAAALKEARHKEHAVFDNAQDIILTLGPDLIISHVNPACQRLWGYTASELSGRSVLDLIVSTGEQNLQQSLRQVEYSLLPFELEMQIRHHDGSIRDMLWSISVSKNDGTYIAIVRDVSKRKEFERFEHEFLSMVSHDMRTPISTIAGAVDLMITGAFGSLPEKAGRQLLVVERRCDRLINLINDLLDLDKMESGQMQLMLQAVAADDILETALEAVDTAAKRKNVTLLVESSCPLLVDADEERLVQTCINLLSNAIKYSPLHGIITASALQAGDFVEFKVRDQGAGIPEHCRQEIFQRYKQEDSGNEIRSGTRLGLPICKLIVELHGGSIGVESREGQGSTFWFRIPLWIEN